MKKYLVLFCNRVCIHACATLDLIKDPIVPLWQFPMFRARKVFAQSKQRNAQERANVKECVQFHVYLVCGGRWRKYLQPAANNGPSEMFGQRKSR